MNRPLFLLLGTGAMLGCNFPLGKMAIAAGVDPVLWAAFICLGAGLSMAVIARAVHGAGPTSTPWRYAATSGFLSNVVPHALTFLAIPKIGSGLAAIMFALSPVTTALLSVALKVRPPSLLGLVGIGFGLVGALVIIFGRNADFAGGSAQWLLLSALIPVFLGTGNVYRTLGWPKGENPLRLASLTNLAAVPPLLALSWVHGGGLDVTAIAAHAGLAVSQLVVSTLMFLMFFRLQDIGGPTYLSQIGYVGAVIGVGAGVLWFRETYPVTVWLGSAAVALGIALTTIAQLKAAHR
jgi:drug/metabolite transporter (DMT)-like permease